MVRPDMLRHALFGPPGSSDLSTERREQLAIAVEPVANPSFIFMDEPTSGLDGQAAAIVMRTALTLLTLEEFVLFTSRVLTYLKHLMSCLCIWRQAWNQFTDPDRLFSGGDWKKPERILGCHLGRMYFILLYIPRNSSRSMLLFWLI